MPTLISFLFSLTIASTVFAADYRANNCEVFVDKVAAWSGSHGYRGLTLKIKTLNDRLDGAIKMVAFHSMVHSSPKVLDFCAKHPAANGNSNGCPNVGKWISRPAHPHFGSDYFKIDLELKHDYNFEHVYEGVIFVETVKGTRYWLKTGHGGNFFVDENMRSDLIRLGSGGYYRQGKDMSTADNFEYLNPSRCR